MACRYDTDGNATGPFCPGGCLTPLESLGLADTVVTESGTVMCRECYAEGDEIPLSHVSHDDYTEAEIRAGLSYEDPDDDTTKEG